jgi:hypothetical protein
LELNRFDFAQAEPDFDSPGDEQPRHRRGVQLTAQAAET